MVWLKSCQRCGGDLYEEKDLFGSYVSCFQCGASVAYFDENATDASPPRVVEDVEVVAAQAKIAGPTPLESSTSAQALSVKPPAGSARRSP